jgi:hypothetical protein
MFALLMLALAGRLTPALAGGARESPLRLRSRPSSARGQSTKVDFAVVGAISIAQWKCWRARCFRGFIDVGTKMLYLQTIIFAAKMINIEEIW